MHHQCQKPLYDIYQQNATAHTQKQLQSQSNPILFQHRQQKKNLPPPILFRPEHTAHKDSQPTPNASPATVQQSPQQHHIYQQHNPTEKNMANNNTC